MSAHGRILVFLQRRTETLEFGCDCGVCLGYVIFEWCGPAIINQGRDDHEFSQ